MMNNVIGYSTRVYSLLREIGVHFTVNRMLSQRLLKAGWIDYPL